MANHQSAIKRIRQNEKRRAHNQHKRSTLTTAIKAVRKAIEKGAKKEAELALKKVIPLIDKAGQKWLVHPKNASRKVSRLSQHVASLK